MRRQSSVVLLAISIASAACASTPASRDDGGIAAAPALSNPADGSVAVLVENNSGLHSVIYAEAGTRMRIGEVKPWTHEILWIPRVIVERAQAIQLVTRQIAGSTFESEAVPLTRGLIVFRIQDQLSSSYVFTRQP